MKPVLKARVLVFAGLLMLLSGVVTGRSVAEKYVNMNGRFGMDKVIVTADERMGRQENTLFSADEARILSESLGADAFTYMARSGSASTSVDFGNHSYPVRINGTNYQFQDFYSMQFVKGCFFSQEAEKTGRRAAVIDDELSWKIFKTSDVVGKTVEMLGGSFTITGVFRKNASLLSLLADDGLPDVYIPMSAMQELDNSAHIGSIQIKIKDGQKETCNLVQTAIYQTGKNPADYNIMDLRDAQALTAQRPMLIIFFAGALSILFLLRYSACMLKKLFPELWHNCMEEGVGRVLKKNGKEIGMDIAGIAGALSGAVLIWKGITFDIYIPSEYIPDELIDIGYYVDLIKQHIQNGITGRGYISPGIELLTNKALMLSGFLFMVSAAAGLLLLYSGFLYLKLRQVDLFKAISSESTAFILAVIILAIAAAGVKMPVSIDIRGLLVLWSALYISTCHFYMKNKSTDKNEHIMV